jgi:hypothetical protein
MKEPAKNRCFRNCEFVEAFEIATIIIIRGSSKCFWPNWSLSLA